MNIALSKNTKGNEYSNCKEILEVTATLGRYDEMMFDFAAFVRGEKQNPFSYEYELQLHKMVLKACGQNIDYKEYIEL